MITCDKCAFCSPTPGGSLYCAWTNHFVPNIGCEERKPIKPMTNADRIRGMDEVGLAAWYCHDRDCRGCEFGASDGCHLGEWLKATAEVQDG